MAYDKRDFIVVDEIRVSKIIGDDETAELGEEELLDDDFELDEELIQEIQENKLNEVCSSLVEKFQEYIESQYQLPLFDKGYDGLRNFISTNLGSKF